MAESIVRDGGHGLRGFKPAGLSFAGLGPCCELAFDPHGKYPDLARDDPSIIVKPLGIRKSANGFSAHGAADTRLFIGFARGGFRRLQSLDGPALGNDPAAGLP